MTARTTDDVLDPALRRRDRETEVGHRAFLLWAMQDPERRSVRACGRAVGRSEACLREWRGKHEWDGRADACGKLATVKASVAYRLLYYGEMRLREIVEVETLLPAPFLPDTPIPSGATIGDQVSEAIRPRKPDEDARRAKEQEQKRRHLALVDGAIGLVAKRIAAGEVKVTLRDVPLLLDLRARMTSEVGPGESGMAAVVVESVRVRSARESGGDLLAAMHDDALELCTILGALRSASEVHAELLQQRGPTTAALGGDDE
jgi:hypothetical protein